MREGGADVRQEVSAVEGSHGLDAVHDTSCREKPKNAKMPSLWSEDVAQALQNPFGLRECRL
jgi:hypothetical protein